jgi:hypothetical protein
MLPAIRLFMAVEAVTFLLAASIHRGFLIPAYHHQAASIGESVIAFVLFIALVLTWIRPASTRLFGLRVRDSLSSERWWGSLPSPSGLVHAPYLM